MANKRTKYSKEYKLNAVKMITEQGRVAAEVARELGISATMLYSWKRKYLEDKEEAYPGNGKLKTTDAYIQKLERENQQLKDERDILKKAAIFFAKDP